MLRALWNRLVKRRDDQAAGETQMSPAERRFVDESVEDRQADLAAESHLGGSSPEHMLEDEKPPG